MNWLYEVVTLNSVIGIADLHFKFSIEMPA